MFNTRSGDAVGYTLRTLSEVSRFSGSMKLAEKVMDSNMIMFYNCIEDGDSDRHSCTPMYL